MRLVLRTLCGVVLAATPAATACAKHACAMEFQQSDHPAQYGRPKLSDCPNGIHNKCEHDVVSDGR